MELLKPVYPNSNLLRFLGNLSIILGLIVFIICFELAAEHYGFGRGYLVSKEYFYKQPENPLVKIVLGQDRYEFLSETYSLIKWSMLFFLIGRLLDKRIYRGSGIKWVSQIICFPSLAFALYQLLQIFYAKSRFLKEWLSSEPYDILIRNSIPWDWICLLILLGLLLSQLIELNVSYFTKKKTFQD